MQTFKFGIKIKLFIVYFFFLTLSSYLLTPTVYAQYLNLSVQPPQIKILMQSGRSLIKAFDFENLGDAGVYSLRVVSFLPNDGEGGVTFKDKAEGPVRFALENTNLDFNKLFLVQARQKIQAVLKIRTIENAPQGDYYYTLFLVSEPTTSQNTAGKSRAMLGANILISITETGFTETTAQVSQLSVIPDYQFTLFGTAFRVIEWGKEAPVVFRIVNTGNYLAVPLPVLKLKGPFGLSKKKNLLPLNVLASSERLMLAESVGECLKCKISHSAVFKGLNMGRYRLSAEVGFEGMNKKIYADTEFWVLPLTLLKYVFGAFVLSLFWLWWHRRGRK